MSGFHCMKLKRAFLKLHCFDLAWFQPVLPGVPQRPPQTPAPRSQPCLCQGKQILGARETAESSFPFVPSVLAYLLALPRQSCLGSTLHTYLGQSFAWEHSMVLRGPRRPTQKLLHNGGSYGTSPDEVHKDFMPQTGLFIRD